MGRGRTVARPCSPWTREPRITSPGNAATHRLRRVADRGIGVLHSVVVRYRTRQAGRDDDVLAQVRMICLAAQPLDDSAEDDVTTVAVRLARPGREQEGVALK